MSKAEKNVVELTTSASEAQNEIKTLQTKLANSRTASVAVESVNARTPGNVMNNKAGQTRTIMMGSAEVAQAAQVALLKEDLYSDLTGLILRGVERREESDIYDCIQTGRNGSKYPTLTPVKSRTLHFYVKLNQANVRNHQPFTSNSPSPTTRTQKSITKTPPSSTPRAWTAIGIATCWSCCRII